MQWFTIVTGVLTLLAIPSLCGLLWKDLYTRKKENSEAAKQEREKKNLEKIREVIKEENEPLRKEMSNLTELTNKMKESDVTLLRDRMQCSLNYCKKQGYRSTSDYSNWMELLNAYKALGGNHFKEYVNSWKQEMEDLPTKDQYIAEKERTRTKKNSK